MAVDLLHSDKRRKKSKRKKLYREDHPKEKNDVHAMEENILSQDVSTSNGRFLASLPQAISVLRSTDRTPFTAEPRPLITGTDLTSYSNSSYATTTNADVSRTPYFGRGRLTSAVVGVARGVVTSDEAEDNEYFSELVDNINKAHQVRLPERLGPIFFVSVLNK